MRYSDFKTLLEYDRSKTTASLGAAIEKRAATDAYLKSQTADPVSAVIAKAEEADPTPNKQYVVWIVRQYIKNNLKYEDIYKLEEDLAVFVKTKGQHRRLGINSDINQYDWKTLADVAKKLGSTDIADTDQADPTQVKDAKVLYNGPLGMLSVPETEAASCELGRGTEWCTAATKSNNMFDRYNKQGPLYIWHDKKKKTKYQFHFESGQFMDVHDQPVADSDAVYLAKENPITSKLMKQKADVVLDKYLDYLDFHSEPPEDDGYGYIEYPDEEILDANLLLPMSAIDDRYFSKLMNTAMNASSLNADANVFKKAWLKELQARPELHSELAKVKPSSLPITYAQYTKTRSQAMENELLAAKYITGTLVKYAEAVIRGAWPEAEPIIAKDGVSAFFYATRVLKGRFPEGEEAIKQSDRNWKLYLDSLKN